MPKIQDSFVICSRFRARDPELAARLSFILCIADPVVSPALTDLPSMHPTSHFPPWFPVWTLGNVQMFAAAAEALTVSASSSSKRFIVSLLCTFFNAFNSSTGTKRASSPALRSFFPPQLVLLCGDRLPFTASVVVIDAVLSAQPIHLRPVGGFIVRSPNVLHHTALYGRKTVRTRAPS